MSSIYTPVIKGKMNDLNAVAKLRPGTRELIKPLIELMRIPEGRTLVQHVTKFIKDIEKYDNKGPSFVDFYGLLPNAKTPSGKLAVIAAYAALKNRGIITTPTFGFDRDDLVWGELGAVIASMGQGFAFRIDIDDLDDQSENTWESILERSAELRIDASATDLIIDLRFIGDKDPDELKDLVIDFLTLKPSAQRYRSIIVLGSSAPKSVAPQVPTDGVAAIVRHELKVWLEVQSDVLGLHNLTYGDYGVVHPEFTDVGPNPNVNAKIRYTYGGKIIIYRGHRLYNPSDFEQYRSLAGKVCRSPAYQGPNYSYGDQRIHDCANHIGGTGHLGPWVQIDMNHHVQYATRQMTALTTKVRSRMSDGEIEQLMETV